jgi:hypothetical protein
LVQPLQALVVGLAPTDEDGRLWTHQIQLTITDIVMEVHNSNHPIEEDKWFHEQKDETIARAAVFRRDRMPKSSPCQSENPSRCGSEMRDFHGPPSSAFSASRE